MYFIHVLLDYNLFEMNISYGFGNIKAINLLYKQPLVQLIVTLWGIHKNSTSSYTRVSLCAQCNVEQSDVFIRIKPPHWTRYYNQLAALVDWYINLTYWYFSNDDCLLFGVGPTINGNPQLLADLGNCDSQDFSMKVGVACKFFPLRDRGTRWRRADRWRWAGRQRWTGRWRWTGVGVFCCCSGGCGCFFLGVFQS